MALVQKVVDIAKKQWCKLLIAANIIILIAAGCSYVHQVNNLISFSFDEEQLAQLTAAESPACFGGTIDENYGSGLYDLYPEVLLKEGSYRYTVSYESTSPESFAWPHSYVEYYNAFDTAVTNFDQTSGTNSEVFWMNIDLNMTFRIYYNGVGSVSFQSFSVEELPYAANVDLFFTVLMLAAADVLIFLWMRRKDRPMQEQTKYVFASLMVISMMASFPLMTGYAINGHDFYFHMTRIEGLKDGLLSGQFPVRINPLFYNGYGYANSVFYGELFLYLPAFLRMIGFTLNDSWLVLIGCVNLLTCFICYYSFNGMMKKPVVALVGTALYTLAPYRLVDIYLRAALGEFIAMTFLPLVLYGMYRIYVDPIEGKKHRMCFVPLMLGLTGVIQSHVLTGEMVALFILSACVIMLPKTLQKKRFCILVKTVLFTVLVNLWFLVPFVDFTLTQDVRVFAKAANADFIQTSGALLAQLFSAFYRYAWKNFDGGEGMRDEMPLPLGLALILGLMLCGLMLWVKNGKESADRGKMRQGAVILFFSVLAIWMSTLYFPWDKFSSMSPHFATLIASLQYVWRFLAPAAALAAAASCYGLMFLEEKAGKSAMYAVATVLCTLTIVSGMYFMQECLNNQSPIRLRDGKQIETVGAASGGEYILSQADHHTVTTIFEPRAFEGCEVTEFDKNGTTITLTVENGDEEAYVLLPLLHYKGYGASSEDQVITDQNLETGEFAVIRLNVPAGYSGEVTVCYEGFWYWRVAEAVSLLTVVYLVLRGHCPKEQIWETIKLRKRGK